MCKKRIISLVSIYMYHSEFQVTLVQPKISLGWHSMDAIYIECYVESVFLKPKNHYFGPSYQLKLYSTLI